MKKVLVFSVLIFVFSGALFAQNANITQRIVGTWVDDRGRTWVFNANGTCATEGSRTTDEKYGVTDTKLAISDSDYGTKDVVTMIYDISMSSDGKILILKYSYIRTNNRTGGIDAGSIEYWLVKK